jgi:2-keto-4-pentenoate hydratase
VSRTSYEIKISYKGLPDYRQIVSEELWKAAERTRQQYQENLEAGKGAAGGHGRPYVGTGEAIARTTVYPELPGADEYVVKGETMQHVIAECGRTPGKKMPPPEPIDRWAREAGLVPREGETWDDMILNIRRHIAAHGLRGFAPAQLAADIVAPTLDRNIQARCRELEK